MKKKEKIIFWGGKFNTKILINTILQKSFDENFLKKKNFIISAIIDPTLKKLDFKTKAPLVNNKSNLKKYINKSKYFVVGIGGQHGKARYLISKELIKKKLKPINIVSNYSFIDKSSILGEGNQIMPNVVIHCFSSVGDFCVFNTSSTIDHDCKIGNGVHVMGGAYIGGNVKIEDYATIGSNATIFPNIKIKKGAFVGAGSVVKKDVSENQIVVGNPAKYLKKNKHYFDLKFFK